MWIRNLYVENKVVTHLKILQIPGFALTTRICLLSGTIIHTLAHTHTVKEKLCPVYDTAQPQKRQVSTHTRGYKISSFAPVMVILIASLKFSVIAQRFSVLLYSFSVLLYYSVLLCCSLLFILLCSSSRYVCVYVYVCIYVCVYIVQGGSNMTGTNCDLFTHKSSRSYLNHLVL